MNTILHQLFEHRHFSREEAKQLLVDIAEGKYNPSQIAAFMTAYCMRSISVEELEGFRDAMLDLCIRIDVSGQQTIDVCGTGGDGKDTFNISTLAAFVVAGAGYKVVKHGNYGVSSGVGSSNVMEALGYTFHNDLGRIYTELEKANICFIHAPLFHPAMRSVAPIRKELAVKTFFNMLGPMVNPAKPSHQFVGVFSLELARLYHYLYQKENKHYSIVHGLDGYDEISLTGPFKCYSSTSDRIVSVADLGFETVTLEDIKAGKDAADSAKIAQEVLENRTTAARKNVVLANAAMAIQCFKPRQSFADCVAEAGVSLESGKALQCLQVLLKK